jgi:hypothetical protein
MSHNTDRRFFLKAPRQQQVSWGRLHSPNPIRIRMSASNFAKRCWPELRTT